MSHPLKKLLRKPFVLEVQGFELMADHENPWMVYLFDPRGDLAIRTVGAPSAPGGAARVLWPDWVPAEVRNALAGQYGEALARWGAVACALDHGVGAVGSTENA